LHNIHNLFEVMEILVGYVVDSTATERRTADFVEEWQKLTRAKELSQYTAGGRNVQPCEDTR